MSAALPAYLEALDGRRAPMRSSWATSARSRSRAGTRRMCELHVSTQAGV